VSLPINLVFINEEELLQQEIQFLKKRIAELEAKTLENKS